MKNILNNDSFYYSMKNTVPLEDDPEGHVHAFVEIGFYMQ